MEVRWRRRLNTTAVVVAALVVAGLAVRIAILVSPLRDVDSDEAVVGLMADDMLAGKFRAFFWGQRYGGVHEPALIAVLFAVGVPRFLALKLVPIGLFAAASVLVWRIARRILGEPAGRLAGAVFWAYPVAVVWMSTKERGFYGATLVLGLGTLLVALRLEEAWRRRDAVVLGVLAGAAWYASPQSLYFLCPTAGWLVTRVVRTRRWDDARRLAPMVVAGLAIGAAPWILANALTGWDSLEVKPQPDTSFGHRLKLFATRGIPVSTGFMSPFERTWLGGGVGRFAAAVTGAAAFVAATVAWFRGRRPPGLAPVLLVMVTYPLLFAAFPTSWFLNDPRYLTFLPAAGVIVAVWLLARSPVALRVAAAGALVVLGVRGVQATLDIVDQPFRWDVVAGDLDPLLDGLDDHGIDALFADYWIAHRLDFETDEAVIAAPLQDIRYPPYEDAVRRLEAPPYVLFVGTPYHEQMREYLEANGIPFEYQQAGAYGLFLPQRRVLPEDVVLDWLAARVTRDARLAT